jgi:hypothetical protein
MSPGQKKSLKGEPSSMEIGICFMIPRGKIIINTPLGRALNATKPWIPISIRKIIFFMFTPYLFNERHRKVFINDKVSRPGNFTPASLRTVREPLSSYGSHHCCPITLIFP